MSKIIIAIDGFSSTGKSTIAKEIAKELSYIYVDTGAMYRGVTLYAIRKGYLEDGVLDMSSLEQDLDAIDLHFEFNPEKGFGELYLNGEYVEEEIRQMEVSNGVSIIAAFSPVRKKLVATQQRMGLDKGVVMDGRDIGTVVFPDAELKLFMTASAETRAERRYHELKEKGQDVSYAEVLHNIEERDRIDTSREDSPLIKADDAIEYDNSNKSREEQLDDIMQLVTQRLEA